MPLFKELQALFPGKISKIESTERAGDGDEQLELFEEGLAEGLEEDNESEAA